MGQTRHFQFAEIDLGTHAHSSHSHASGRMRAVSDGRLSASAYAGGGHTHSLANGGGATLRSTRRGDVPKTVGAAAAANVENSSRDALR